MTKRDKIRKTWKVNHPNGQIKMTITSRGLWLEFPLEYNLGTEHVLEQRTWFEKWAWYNQDLIAINDIDDYGYVEHGDSSWQIDYVWDLLSDIGKSNVFQEVWDYAYSHRYDLRTNKYETRYFLEQDSKMYKKQISLRTN